MRAVPEPGIMRSARWRNGNAGAPQRLLRLVQIQARVSSLRCSAATTGEPVCSKAVRRSVSESGLYQTSALRRPDGVGHHSAARAEWLAVTDRRIAGRLMLDL